MKNKLNLIFLVLMAITVVNSCQKESFLDTNLSKDNENSKIQVSCKSGQVQDIYKSNGLLVFKDIQTLELTLTSLEQQVNSLDESFISSYGNLGENAINQKEEELGFDELEPLKGFERIYGLKSLREKIEKEERKWLQNPTLDELNDPDDHFIIDEFVRTILNEDAEIMIGSSIYKFIEDGSYYEIIDGNFETLEQIKQGIDVEQFENVIHHNIQKTTSDCKTNKWNSGYKKSGSYRIKWKVGIYNYPWQCGMKSKVISYKRKSNGKWKRYRTNLKVGIEGKYCTEKETLSSSTGWVYSDRSNKKYWSVKITGVCQTKSSAVHGYHYGNGISYNSTLTF